MGVTELYYITKFLGQEICRIFAEERCARCHAIGAEGESPFALAPPFREIAERYSYKMLNECEAFDGLVPTTENFAQVVYDDLAPAIAGRAGA